MNPYERIEAEAEKRGWKYSTRMRCAHGLAGRNQGNYRCKCDYERALDHQLLFIMPDKTLMLMSFPYFQGEMLDSLTREYAEKFVLMYDINPEYEWYAGSGSGAVRFWATPETRKLTKPRSDERIW